MNPANSDDPFTILIVDDTPANLAYLSDALVEAGYKVLVATDGSLALEQIRYLTPDLILLDVLMPGLDGFETCRQLKADPLSRAIPVIFMTALGELDALLRGFGEGAVDYLVKPVRHEEVLARVSAQLVQAQWLRKAQEALDRSGIALLTVDPAGAITWLTPAASTWLAELAGVLGTKPARDCLPEPLAAWVRNQSAGGNQEIYIVMQGGRRWVARWIPCHDGEDLLLLSRDSWAQELGLTPREAEILMWIARSKTNREVGQILGISPRTVNKHLEHVFEKLGVATRAAAVAKAMEQGWLAHPP